MESRRRRWAGNAGDGKVIAFILIPLVAFVFSIRWRASLQISSLPDDKIFQKKPETPGAGTRDIERLIMASTEIVDTRKIAGLKRPESCKSSRRGWSFRDEGIHSAPVTGVAVDNIKQFYVQTNPTLSTSQRLEIEADLGTALGSYFPNNAYIFLGSEVQARRALCSRYVVWVGERPANHKMDPGLLVRNVSEVDSGWIGIYATLVDERFRPSHSASDLAEEIVQMLKFHMGIDIKARVASPIKLSLELDAYHVHEISEKIAEKWWVEWIERKALFSTRIYAGNRLVLAGNTEDAKLIDILPTVELGLDGTGQVLTFRTFSCVLTY
jgi:hypothetical protein